MAEAEQDTSVRWWMKLATAPDLGPVRHGTAATADDPGDRSADVVVVGAGMAGYAAAISAADAGASVLMLDAATQPGGTTARSGGSWWIPDNGWMRERGVTEDREATLRLMAQLSFPDRYDPDAPALGLDELEHRMLVTYYDTGAGIVQALHDQGDLRSMEYGALNGEHPIMASFYADLEDETVPFGRILAPQRPDGLMSTGPEAIRQLAAAAERRGIELLLEHRVTGVRTGEDGAITALTAETPHGARVIAVGRGAVFASGGFAHDPDLCGRHLRGPVLGTCAAPTMRGDFVRIAEGLGAAFGNMANGWWTQLPLELTLASREHIQTMLALHGDSMILVNAAGDRVVDEKANYQDRTAVQFVRDEHGALPNRLLFMIYDDDVAGDERPMLNRVPSYKAGEPHVLSADTLPDLADRIAARLAELGDRALGVTLGADFVQRMTASVERFSAFARAGVDEDFGRGRPEAIFQEEWDSPTRPGYAGNGRMHPFAPSGPYHAMIIAPAVMDTNGGPLIDPGARVLREDRTPIPRLYAAGNCAASPAGAAYWSGGSTLGPAVVFGVLAGASAAAEAPRA
jgi:3-oxosteroid 1-dehydrogenase